MKKTNYEAIIIGGSYAGLAAAMSLGRSLREVLVIDSGNPCNKQTPHSHNFVTQDGEAPADIARKVKKELANYAAVSFLAGLVTAVKQEQGIFKLDLEDGTHYRARKLLFATGIKNIMPGIDGFAACWGISVLHCPYCHGYEVRNTPTGILANGDSAYELARLISHWTRDLTIFTDGSATLTREQKLKLAERRIPIVESPVGSIAHRNGRLTHVVFADGSRHELNALYARPPFQQHCALPEGLGCAMTPEGFIKTDDFKKTSIPGVFAAGDNTTPMRSVAAAVAAGSAAGAFINHELIAEQF